MLHTDKASLELLQNRAVQFTTATQIMSITEGLSAFGMKFVLKPDFESNQPPITLLQKDKTPLEIFSHQAMQFSPSPVLAQLKGKTSVLGTKFDCSVDSADEQRPIALLSTNSRALDMLRHTAGEFKAATTLALICDGLAALKLKRVPSKTAIELLQTDKVPLEVFRNTAAQFTTATQLVSLSGGIAARHSKIERPHPSLELLQIDKTPLELLKEQATQFATSSALCQLPQLLHSTPYIQKSKSVTPPQTLVKLIAAPEPLRHLAEQGRILAEYDALERLTVYLQAFTPPLRTRPATLQKLEAHPDLLQTMQDLAAEVIEYDALYTIWQQLQQQSEQRKILEIQREEAQQHRAQNFLLQLPFIKITDAFRIECENIVSSLLDKAREEQHDDTNTHAIPQALKTRQDGVYNLEFLT